MKANIHSVECSSVAVHRILVRWESSQVEAVPDAQVRGARIPQNIQVGLGVPDPRAMHGVAAPQLIGVGGLEPAEHRRMLFGVRAHQIQPVKMAQQGGLRRRPPGCGAQDPGHLRHRAGRVFPLQRRGQLQHLRVGTRGQPPRCGHQRLEPASAVAADPAVQRLPRDAHLVAEWVGMGTGGDLAHQLAGLLGRQPLIQGRADQLIAEQPERLRPLAALVLLQRHFRFSSPIEGLPETVAGQAPWRGSPITPPRVRGDSCCAASAAW